MSMNNPFPRAISSVRGTTAMQVSDFYATIHMPVANQSIWRHGQEIAQGLPPYAEQMVYRVDDIPGAPNDLLRSSANVSSYVVGIQEGRGMWFDFRLNNSNAYDVAVVLSVQGVNALDCMETDYPALRHYRQGGICPQHGTILGQDGYCASCGYSLPPQNYLSTTMPGPFWRDGFFNERGEIRQWVFTQEQARGVAWAFIGHKRVNAIGIAFFRSMNPKPVQQPTYRSPGSAYSFGATKSCGPTRGLERSLGGFPSEPSFEVAAGAKILQGTPIDHKPLTYWNRTPQAFIVVNYMPVDQLMKLVGAGQRGAAGPLDQLGIQLGN